MDKNDIEYTLSGDDIIFQDITTGEYFQFVGVQSGSSETVVLIEPEE